MQNLMNFAPKWLQSVVSQNFPPDQVRDVDSGNYASYRIRRREESMILYGPILQPQSLTSQDGETPPSEIFDILVPSVKSKHTSHSISVFRTRDLAEADARFDLYNRIIPVFLEVRPDLYSTSNLQKLCDAVRNNPEWSLCHIAVHLDIIDTLKHPRFQSDLTAVTDQGLSVLMLAVRGGSKHITTAVLAAEASICGVDELGNNCFHLAATKTSQLVEILANSKQCTEETLVQMLNQKNKDGKTPLHLACLADNQDIVVSMLCSGADINSMGVLDEERVAKEPRIPTADSNFRSILKQYPNQLYVKDIKNGGTPLHWAMEKPVLEAFIDIGCDLSSKDFHGSTALHTMIKHKRLPCIVSLLSYGANVEERDAHGNTPLHLAAFSGHIGSVQALLIFEANYSAVNQKGERAWDIVLKTHQNKMLSNLDKERNMLLYTLHGVGDRGPASLETVSKEFDWKPKETEESQIYKRSRHMLDKFLDQTGLNVKESRKGGVRILSLDGGGIRGLVLVKILTCINNVSKVPITDMFDWIGGTSTGGILTLALACGKTPRECQGLYFRLKDKVFVGRRPYDVAPLEEFLKRELSDTKTMAELPPQPRITVTGVMADRHPADLHFFTNYQRPADILGVKEALPPGIPTNKKPDEQELWRAGRCSGAAPTYFRAAGKFIDGGLISNNPTLDLMTEVYELNCALRAVGREKETESIGIVVSLGTGEPPLEKVDSVDLFIPDSILNVPQLYFGVSAMGRLLIDQACSASNSVVDRARAWCGMADIAYVRFSPQLDSDVKLDETKDEVLVNMIYLTQVYMYEHRVKVETLVTQLLQPRNR